MEREKGSILNIGNKQYKVWCVGHTTSKWMSEDDMKLSLHVVIYNMTDDKYMSWKEIKGTYLEEKVSDYLRNSANGQQTFYWKW